MSNADGNENTPNCTPRGSEPLGPTAASAAPPSAPVAALIAAGDHLAAARLAVERGELEQAIHLYDRLWRFADALPLALRLEQRPLAVRLALDLGDPRRAGEIADTMPRDAAADLMAAASAFAARGRYLDAGRLAERAGDRAAAAAFFRRAGSLLDAGRIEEAAGRFHEAGVAYELGRARAASDEERAAAELALGRLFGRLGRPEDAARAFQRAMRVVSFRLPAGQALVGALLALGFPVAANEIATRLRRDKPDLPASLDEIASLDAADAAAGGFRAGGLGAETVAPGRRFKVVRSLGAGATSQVYLAEDALLGLEVALKLLSFGGASSAEGQAYARFAREAEAAGRLRHPHIVALHDADAAAGLFVFELMAGGALADRLADGQALSPAAARRLALDLLAALGAAHDQGIVHRDVKPANVLFDLAGNAKLGDFGAAHLADFGQTQTGGLLGTVAYMSPEQITGGRIGPAADLYAVGILLFQCLTGRLPFQGPDVVAEHLTHAPPVPSRCHAGLTDVHDAVLLRALRKAPDERWESARDMADAVRRWPAEAAPTEPGAAGSPSALETTPGDEVPEGRAGGRGAPVGDEFLGCSEGGRLFRHADTRLGRPVLVERREEPLTSTELERLRVLAGLGGPHVQRVLSLSDDEATVTYEFLDGPRLSLAAVTSSTALPLGAAEALLRAHAAMAAAGGRQTGENARVVLTRGGPVLAVVVPSND